MRIPEPLFPVINRVMRLLLSSPLHALMSGSVMVIHYTGRRTGRPRWTPVRYLRESDDTIVCLTGSETGWWPNFLEPRDVRLQLAGRRVVGSRPGVAGRYGAQGSGLARSARANSRPTLPTTGSSSNAAGSRRRSNFRKLLHGTWWYRSTSIAALRLPRVETRPSVLPGHGPNDWCCALKESASCTTYLNSWPSCSVVAIGIGVLVVAVL